MSPTLRSDITAAYPIAVDAFLTLSRIHLESLEHLSTLNIDTARQVVSDLAATARDAPQIMVNRDSEALQSMLGTPLWERAVTYSSNTLGIVAGAQQEVAKTMAGLVFQGGMADTTTASWSALFETFARAMRQVTTSIAQGAGVVADASAKSMATVLAKERKAA